MTAPAYGFELTVAFDTLHLQHTVQTLWDRLEFGVPNWMRDDLVDHLQQRARGRFAGQGDDASGPWAPLKPATEAIRASLGYSPAGPINIRTHDLYNYIVSDGGTVNYSGGWTMTWPDRPGDQETLDKLQTAQRGKPSPNTIDRPVVALGVTDYNDILDSLAAFIVDGLI